MSSTATPEKMDNPDLPAFDLRKEINKLRARAEKAEANLASERNANNEGLALEYDRRVKAEADLAAARADVARLTLERDTISAELEKLEITWGGLASDLATARECASRFLERAESAERKYKNCLARHGEDVST